MADHTCVTVEAFVERARAWMLETLPSTDDEPTDPFTLQRLLFDHGFAGIAFSQEYGGAGLTLDHQRAFYQEAHRQRRQIPSTSSFMVSIGMLAPTILDHGSEQAKKRFLPPLLRGDELWIQLLSEPRGGSDLAGATTRLTRDGDTYVLSGAKMWSSGAYMSDFGLCLCRTDWDAPKHRGLSMIAVPLKNTPGLTIQRTRSASGLPGEFCEEFFDDVVLPLENLIGEENQGWSVAQSLLFHERNAVGNIGYGYLSAERRHVNDRRLVVNAATLAAQAQVRGTSRAAAAEIADVYINSVVGPLTSARLMTGMRVGTHKGPWGSLSSLQRSVDYHRSVRTALIAMGAEALVWEGDEVETDNFGTSWLEARGGRIGGGTSEMQRNIISERLLGLPREPASDRDIPFNEVLRNIGKT